MGFALALRVALASGLRFALGSWDRRYHRASWAPRAPRVPPGSLGSQDSKDSQGSQGSNFPGFLGPREELFMTSYNLTRDGVDDR
ncbi:hypothetical protein BZA77DRAFT_328070 [Pyronema omphalodes]|nr:hypothetical protein BZA77DRAFT_328070 [Pyronema omphalodes]